MVVLSGILAIFIGVSRGLNGQASAPDAPWASHLQQMDEALARQDVSQAIGPWNAAYDAAVRSGGWEGMAAVGEAYLRLTDRAGGRGVLTPAVTRAIVARGVFETVFERASQQQSVEGVLSAAKVFAALGDLAMADRCREMAGRLAGSCPGQKSTEGSEE